MPSLPSGFAARPVNPAADVPLILELCEAAALADYGVLATTEQMVRGAYSLPSFDVETDSLLVLDPEGRAAAVAEYYDGEELHVAPYLFLRVRPENRDDPILP